MVPLAECRLPTIRSSGPPPPAAELERLVTKTVARPTATSIMKPYAKLTRADLEQSPVWEWVPEGDSADGSESIDESFVGPTDLIEIPTESFGQFIVAATIELKSGDRHPGIADVTTDRGTVSIEPTTVFLLDRHLQIPGVETNRLLTRYTKSMDNCPVSWSLVVPIQGEKVVRTGPIKHGDMKEIVEMGIQALLALKGLRKK